MDEALDIYEVFAAGGLCYTGTCETFSGLSCCGKMQRIFAFIYLITNAIFCVADVALEGLAINECSGTVINSTAGVSMLINFDSGLYVWKAAYIAMTTLVLPVDLWFTSYNLFKTPTCCWGNKTDDGYCANPYCLCSNKENRQRRIEVTQRLFLLFEELVLISMSVGKVLFASQGSANLAGYQNSSNKDAVYFVLVVGSIGHLFRFQKLCLLYLRRIAPADRKCCLTGSTPSRWKIWITLVETLVSTFAVGLGIVCAVYMEAQTFDQYVLGNVIRNVILIVFGVTVSPLVLLMCCFCFCNWFCNCFW